MSGMDRLTDEELEGISLSERAGSDTVLMARELLARRRASQAAPAPSDGLREAVDAAWNDAIEAAAKDVEEWGLSFGDLDPVQPRVVADDIRALRRSAPTEGEA